MKPVSSHRKAVPPSTGTNPALLGQQLLGAGKLNEKEITAIVAAQGRTKLRFGETAIALGLATEADVQEVLARQYEYPISRRDSSNFSSALVAAEHPFGARSEAFRTLRTQLTLRWLGEGSRCLAITSSRAGEGASVLAANLAIVFAQAGERTLLIDANFRRPNQHALFGIESGFGLSGLLTGRCSAADVLAPTPLLGNLYVLCAGALPPNPQELLNRVGFSYLVETAPAEFDIVIIDTPPILEFADAQLVAARTGACLLSVRRDITRVADVQKVKSLFEPSPTQFVGAVMSG
ncbi:MAG: polysaccharide biosynthesis tyrosine autokinase [Gammaproteobacteria bacterium]